MTTTTTNSSRCHCNSSILISLLLTIANLCLAAGTNLTDELNKLQVPQAADRIRNEPDSVWIEFIQLALDHKPLNLGQGFPDFAAPQYLVESLRNATEQSGDQKLILNHQYTRSFGHPRLVKALQKYYNQHRQFDKLLNANDQLLVTLGAYEALFTAIMAFVNPGDEVLIIDPAFDAYAPMVAMAGGRSVYIPLRFSGESTAAANSSLTTEQFRLDMAEFEQKVTNRTRVLILNTPSNPLGKIYSRQELEQVARLCIRHNILVVADEVYEQIYYEPYEHVSIASLPGMWPRTVTIGSAGKTFSVTGWKIGWAFGPSHLLRYLQLVHQTAVYTVATPLQEAVARALEHEMELIERLPVGGNGRSRPTTDGLSPYWTELRKDLAAKRSRMVGILERARMRPILPQGGYFLLADFSTLARLFPQYSGQGHSIGVNRSNSNDFKFARWLSREKHLQGIPASAFYSEQNKHLAKDLIRFCFIKAEETLDKFDRLIGSLLKSTQ